MKAFKLSLAALALSLLAIGHADARGWGGPGHGGGFGGRGGYAAPRAPGGMRERPQAAPRYDRGAYPAERSYAPRAFARPEMRGYPAYQPRPAYPAYPAYAAPRNGYRRGQFMPRGLSGAEALDPHRYRLRSPPPGYAWYGVGRDAYLVQRSTGLILDTAPGAW